MPTTVLLADDHELIRKAIKSLLKRDSDIDLVGESASFAETMRLAADLKPQVVVMDLHIDDEKSPDAQEIKTQLAGANVIAISVWGHAEEAQTLAKSYGAVTLLDKMTLSNDLIPAIKQWGAGKN